MRDRPVLAMAVSIVPRERRKGCVAVSRPFDSLPKPVHPFPCQRHQSLRGHLRALSEGHLYFSLLACGQPNQDNGKHKKHPALLDHKHICCFPYRHLSDVRRRYLWSGQSRFSWINLRQQEHGGAIYSAHPPLPLPVSSLHHGSAERASLWHSRCCRKHLSPLYGNASRLGRGDSSLFSHFPPP